MAPSGWYPDPATPGSLRFWDGNGWTEHSAGPADESPEPAPVAPVEAGEVVFDELGQVPAELLTTSRSAAVRSAPAPAAELHEIASGGSTATATLDRPALAESVAPAPAPPRPAGRHSTRGTLRPELTTESSYPGTQEVSPTFLAEPEPTGPSPRTMIIGAAVAFVVLVVAFFGYQWWRQATAVDQVNAAFAAEAQARILGTEAATASLTGFLPAAANGTAWVSEPAGAALSSPTFAGWCGQAAPSDADRIARKEWTLQRAGTAQPVSVEAVAYRTPAAAAEAFAQFAAATANCIKVVVRTDAATLQYAAIASRVQPPPVVLAQGMSAVERVGRAEKGTSSTKHIVAIVQQRGQFVSVIWATQPGVPTPADRDALEPLTFGQSVALAASPLP